MKLEEIIKKTDMEILNIADSNGQVKGCYIGDLLSRVMAEAQKDEIWITIQGHQNIIAVSLLADLSAVVVVEEVEIEEEAIKKAVQKGVTLLRTDKSAYQLAKELSKLGV